MSSFLAESLATAIAMLVIVSIFAVLGSGTRMWGGRTSFAQMFFVLMFAFMIVAPLSGAARSAAQLFGTVIVMPILAIAIFLLRVRFKRD